MADDGNATPQRWEGRVIASQFRMQRKLGAGGMGTVFLAEQLGMDRQVVIKLLHEHVAAGSTASERFKREARAVARLNHPNIVQVFVFGSTDDNQLYLAMEYVEGRTLHQEIQRGGPIPEVRVLRVLDQICSALIEAHGAGIVHRDLKPENVMLCERYGVRDYVKVLDFGIAKLLGTGEPDGTLTQAGAVSGTPRYMAPEQAKASGIDARADLYTLGLMAYEMLTGHHPFQAETAMEFIVLHATEPVQAPSSRFPDIPVQPRTESLVMRCLQKPPAERFQSAAELQREVRLALRDLPPAVRSFPTPAPPPSRPSRPPQPRPQAEARGLERPPSRAWLIAGLAVLGLLLVAGGVALGMWWLRGPSAEPERVDRANEAVAVVFPRDVRMAERPARVGRRDLVAEATPPPEDPPPEDPPPEDPPPEDPLPEDPPPEAPLVEAGDPIEGIVAPRGARLVTQTREVVVIEASGISPAQALAFYRHHLSERFDNVQQHMTSLIVKDPDAPMQSVTVTHVMGRTTITAARNPLLAPPPQELTVGDGPFGLPLMPDMTVAFKADKMVIYDSPRPLREVIAFYHERFGRVQGMMVVQDETMGYPRLVLMANSAPTAFRMLTVDQDPTRPGHAKISLFGR